MAPKRERDIGTGLIVGAILLAALGNWDTLAAHMPEQVRPYVVSPLSAIVLALAGIYFLWRAASQSVRLAEDLARAVVVANEANHALRNRIDAAEEKLVKAIDQQAIDWSPAIKRLQEQFDQELRNHLTASIRELRDAYNSFRRRAERGYLGGDDISGAPPPITPKDI